MSIVLLEPILHPSNKEKSNSHWRRFTAARNEMWVSEYFKMFHGKASIHYLELHMIREHCL